MAATATIAPAARPEGRPASNSPDCSSFTAAAVSADDKASLLVQSTSPACVLLQRQVALEDAHLRGSSLGHDHLQDVQLGSREHSKSSRLSQSSSSHTKSFKNDLQRHVASEEDHVRGSFLGHDHLHESQSGVRPHSKSVRLSQSSPHAYSVEAQRHLASAELHRAKSSIG